MSRVDNDSTMTQQDAVAADELKRFCQQLVFHGQFKSVRLFKAGSMAEIENCGYGMKACGLALEEQNVDMMYYIINQGVPKVNFPGGNS